MLLALTGTLSTVAAKQPNVIVVLADDMGYGDVTALNPESKIPTPYLDAMAARGIVFTDAHATSSLSTPSRYSILTGRYPWRTTLKNGVLGGYSEPMIAAERSTIANLFQRHGYTTAIIGKWHLGWNWSHRTDNPKEVDFTAPITNGPTDRGFDYFYGLPASLDMAPYLYVENNRVTAPVTAHVAPQKGLNLMHGGVAAEDFDAEKCLPNLLHRATDYIAQHKEQKQPFFLYLPITAPHTPVVPTQEFVGKSGIGPYGDFVMMVDHLMGQILETLETNGLAENTIVVFTTDNGCAPYVEINKLEQQGHFPSYIYRGYKSDIFEGGHRIPLIISWGDRYTGTRNDDLVSLGDLYATFAQMLGDDISTTEAEDSFSFWPVLTQNGQATRPNMIIQSGQGMLSLVDRDMKLILGAGSGGWGYPNKPEDLKNLPALQLYDLKNDPGERHNLIKNPQYADQIEQMKEMLRRQIDSGRSTPGPSVGNDTKGHWKNIDML